MKYKAYPEYKDSGVEWFGEIPIHWNVAALRRSLLDHKQGYYTTDDYVEDGVKIVRITDLRDYGDVDFSNCPRVPSENFNLINFELNNGDVIFARTGGAGSFGVIKGLQERVVFASYLIRFRFYESNFINDYLKYMLIADSFQKAIKQNIHGGVNQNIHADDIKGAFLARSPLDEQIKIANFLDHETAKIDTLIEKQQQLIQLLKEKRQAVISHAVTKGLNPDVPMRDSGVEWLGYVPEHWRIAGFKKYLNPIVDYRGKTPEKKDTGIFLITARNIKNGKINYDLSQEYIAESDYENVMSRGKPKIGDIIFTTEAPLGEVASVDREDIALAQRIIKFDGQSGVLNNEFLKYLIMSSQFQQSLMMFASGSTALGIKAERLVYLRALIPPIDEQMEIVKYIEVLIDRVDNLITKAEMAIGIMQERRTALISAAVTGKIDVRNWQPPKTNTSEAA